MEWSPQTIFGAQRVNMQRTAWILILEDFCSLHRYVIPVEFPKIFKFFQKKMVDKLSQNISLQPNPGM